MWYLIEENPDLPPAPKYWLGGVGNTQGVSIGRKHVDIRLKASSVSRTHAKLVVEKAPFHAHPHPHRRSTIVSVSDSSAYGTFLKYPKGHSSSRNLNSHHIRLDKDKPQQIFDGALLSFGAPAAWWKLVWHHILIFPFNLSSIELKHINHISLITGLDITNNLILDCTHLVTNTCNPQRMKFLTALLSDSFIVTPAWVEALHYIVKNAFNRIPSASNSEAAEEFTMLPDEFRYLPKFEASDIQLFGEDVTNHAFEQSIVQARKTLFHNFVFIFAREKLRTKWDKVLNLCAGYTMAATTDDIKEQNTNKKQIILVYCNSASNASQSPPSPPAGIKVFKTVSETCLIHAILAANVDRFDDVIGPTKSEPVSDVIEDDNSMDENEHKTTAVVTDTTDTTEQHQNKRRRLNDSAVNKVRVVEGEQEMSISDLKSKYEGKRHTSPSLKNLKSNLRKRKENKVDTSSHSPSNGRHVRDQDNIDIDSKDFERIISDDLQGETNDVEEDNANDKDNDNDNKDAATIPQDRNEVETVPLEGSHEELDNYRAFRPSRVAIGSRFGVREANSLDDEKANARSNNMEPEGQTDGDENTISRRKALDEYASATT